MAMLGGEGTMHGMLMVVNRLRIVHVIVAMIELAVCAMG